MVKFNKLVRDKIPQIIEKSGAVPVTRILDREEYLTCLEAKLDEEVREFHESKAMEELADILGHASIDTTRIYIASSGKEHLKKMQKMHLII